MINLALMRIVEVSALLAIDEVAVTTSGIGAPGVTDVVCDVAVCDPGPGCAAGQSC